MWNSVCTLYTCTCRSSFGVLKTCFGEGDLELYRGSLPLTVEGWKKDPVLSLREAAKMLNPLNEFQVGRCNCKGSCRDQRCACRKRGSPCTSKCHQGTACSNCPPSPTDRPAKRRKVCTVAYFSWLNASRMFTFMNLDYTLMCIFPYSSRLIICGMMLPETSS